MDKILMIGSVAILFFVMIVLYFKGMSDTYSSYMDHEKKLCKEDHWRSAHCYEVFKESQNAN